MFTLKISTGNEAFRDENENLDCGANEVISLLKKTISSLENGNTSGKLMDISGNKVGEWSYTDDNDENVKDALFTSVWDGGYKVTTKCKVNINTGEVFDIEPDEDNADFLHELDDEYITLDNEKYHVYNKAFDDVEDDEFWYDE